jgi:large subunit ribosomal protein L2
MAIKRLKPTTPTRRHTILIDRSELSKERPVKSLKTSLTKYHAGRNNTGKLSVRHRGGAGRRQYRQIDFKRDNFGVKGTVDRIEYDPNRTAFIALIKFDNGDWRYILAPDKLAIGDVIESGPESAVKVGNSIPLKKVPQGTFVHAVETELGRGAILGRSAGTSIQVQGGEKGYVQLKLPSGEIRLVKEDCYATVGSVSNADQKNVKLGKAGRKRHMGIRPTVRGVAMSYKHPHGAGQGKKGKGVIGGIAKDFWGNRVGKRTRTNKSTDKYIVRRRTVKSGRKFKKTSTII